MTPTDLRDWRKRLHLTQARAAEVLGIAKRTYEQYESGKRADGGSCAIPRYIDLACAAVALGITRYP
jgi:transcriptional regulator with XRE-family HTH domain